MGIWIQKLIEKFLGKQPEMAAPEEVQPEPVALPDFKAMTKLELEAWADKELGIKLDRRKSKKSLIDQIQNHLNKEN